MTKAPTKAERRRFIDMQSIGCIACYIDGNPGQPADVHHILSGGKRIGHSATIPLCPFHHKAESVLPIDLAEERYGPTLARSKRKFIERYGTEERLLRRVNEMLEWEAQRNAP